MGIKTKKWKEYWSFLCRSKRDNTAEIKTEHMQLSFLKEVTIVFICWLELEITAICIQYDLLIRNSLQTLKKFSYFHASLINPSTFSTGILFVKHQYKIIYVELQMFIYQYGKDKRLSILELYMHTRDSIWPDIYQYDILYAHCLESTFLSS